jgi:NAD(P)H dehydrogenase (quinone)
MMARSPGRSAARFSRKSFVACSSTDHAGVLRIPYPADTRLSLVDLDDVAEVAARVLTQDGHVGATYELAGTAPMSQTEVAAAIGAALGRAIRVEAEPVEAWEARVGAAGMGDHERITLAAMFRYYARHGLVENPNTLRSLLGRAPHDLAHFLVDYA